jgi:hypothetical protein
MTIRRRTIAWQLAVGLLAMQLHDARADDPLIINVICADTTIAIQERGGFLNCSSLDPELFDRISKQWQEDVEKATRLLAADPRTHGYVAEFKRETSVEALMGKMTAMSYRSRC